MNIADQLRFRARVKLFPDHTIVRYAPFYLEDAAGNLTVDGRWQEASLSSALNGSIIDLVPPGTDLESLPHPRWSLIAAAFHPYIEESSAAWEALKAKAPP